MRASLQLGALVLAGASAVQAHGLEAEIEAQAPFVGLRCAYTNGEPADAEVLVYSPDEPGRAFQMLRTDLRGRAAFVPDAPGEWRVVVDDGLGHRADLSVSVGADGLAQTVPESAGSSSLAQVAAVAAALAALAWAWRKLRSGRVR